MSNFGAAPDYYRGGAQTAPQGSQNYDSAAQGSQNYNAAPGPQGSQNYNAGSQNYYGNGASASANDAFVFISTFFEKKLEKRKRKKKRNRQFFFRSTSFFLADFCNYALI